MDDETRAWLVLAAARPGAAAQDALLDEFGSAVAIVSQSPSSLARFGLEAAVVDAIRRPDEAALRPSLKWAEGTGNHLVHCLSDDYPPLLAETRGRPCLLYVKGDPGILSLPTLAIVGSRNPTRGGLDTAFEFSRYLADAGFSIASGLAQGIDTAAHRGALEASATTVAVLGHGIDRVYPAGNRELAHRIAETGALVTEFPPGTAPLKEHFPARNRIISGLSVGTLVVEAAYRSGSLITARLASEQGREVFAIPGSIHNPLARGCHRLIRDGAKLVESAKDIIDELRPLIGHLMQHNESAAGVPRDGVERDPEYDELLEAMGFEPLSADEIAGKSGLTIDRVSSMLLILELEGDIEVLQGGRYSRLKSS